jgi:hypothetical protein
MNRQLLLLSIRGGINCALLGALVGSMAMPSMLSGNAGRNRVGLAPVIIIGKAAVAGYLIGAVTALGWYAYTARSKASLEEAEAQITPFSTRGALLGAGVAALLHPLLLVVSRGNDWLTFFYFPDAIWGLCFGAILPAVCRGRRVVGAICGAILWSLPLAIRLSGGRPTASVATLAYVVKEIFFGLAVGYVVGGVGAPGRAWTETAAASSGPAASPTKFSWASCSLGLSILGSVCALFLVWLIQFGSYDSTGISAAGFAFAILFPAMAVCWLAGLAGGLILLVADCHGKPIRHRAMAAAAVVLSLLYPTALLRPPWSW